MCYNDNIRVLETRVGGSTPSTLTMEDLTISHDWKIIKTTSGIFVGHECQKCRFRLGDWRGYVEYPSLENPPQKIIETIVGKCHEQKINRQD